ncbi:MBL fold metallo-hydrolase [Paenibacillus marinisediminis]
MNIADGVAMLELNIQGFILNPTLIWDEDTAILMDTGMPGQAEAIREAMNKAGVPYERLKAVILTHQDIDHIGSIQEIVQGSNQHIAVYAHEMDKPYIEGTLPLLKADRKRMSSEEWESLPAAMKYIYENPPRARVDMTLEDGQELPYCGGLRVIHTPGHTPGHICLYLKSSRTLVAGDAMIRANGSLRGPVPRATLDMDIALDSLKKLLDLDIERVICYHGGLSVVNVKEQLHKLVEPSE